MAKRSFTYNGKRYWVVRKDPADLPDAIAEKKLELKNEELKETHLLFKNYADQWRKVFKEPFVGKDSNNTYKAQIKILNNYFGWKKMKDVTSTDVQNAITSECNSGKSKSSVDKTYMTVKQIFKRAKIDRLIKADPTEGISKPKMEEKTERALTDEEYAQVIELCKTSKYGMWILSMLLLGLRPNEAARMKVEHYDPETGLMFIDGTKSARAKRYIPLCEPLKSFVEGFNGTGYIFTTSDGKPLDRFKTQRWWEYFKREWDLYAGAETYRNRIVKSKLSPDVHLYMFRHTFATRMAPNVSVNVLADIMGHSNINIAYKYYIHYNIQNMDSVRKAMGGALDGAPKNLEAETVAITGL